jgi:hypothetical protein
MKSLDARLNELENKLNTEFKMKLDKVELNQQNQTGIIKNILKFKLINILKLTNNRSNK